MPIMNRGRTNTDHERHPGDEPRDAPSPTKFTPQRVTSTPTNKGKRPKKARSTTHDLPIAGPNPNSAIEYYSNLPVQRYLDWQTDENNRPIIRELTNNLSRLAAFVQTRGTEASEPCSFCSEQLGAWRSCIIGSDTTADTKVHGSCANCRFSRRYTCAHRIYRESSEDTGSSSGTREGTEPSSRPVDNEGFHIARPVSDEEVERFLLLLQPKSSQQCGPNAQKTPDVQGSNDPKSVTTKGQESGKNVTCIATTSSADVRVRCKHDGKAIPFPLRPEAFHDLPLLRQALLDMTQHYNVIRRRTEQIEGTEQYRSTVNPGILLRMGNHAHYVVCRAR